MATTIVRNKHTGQPGNPGSFSGHSRDADTISLSPGAQARIDREVEERLDDAIMDHRESAPVERATSAMKRIGATIVTGGSLSGLAGIISTATADQPLIPLAAIFGGMAVTGIGSAIYNAAENRKRRHQLNEVALRARILAEVTQRHRHAGTSPVELQMSVLPRARGWDHSDNEWA